MIKLSRYAAIGVILLAVASGILLVAQAWSLREAQAVAAVAAQGRRSTINRLLSSELQKYRMLPLVLADYPDVQRALEAPTTDVLNRLDARLELIAGRTDAAVIYVLSNDGTTIASSNWRRPTSFIGQRYSFRPYFADALRRGSAEQFGVGTVSRRPGLYLARRVTGGGGVIVVKVEFDRLERAWSRVPGETLVRDGNGVVIMSSRPDWRLRTTHPLDPATLRAITSARLYGDNPPLALTPGLNLAADGAVSEGSDHRRYVGATVPIALDGWTLTTLEPLETALAVSRARMQIVALATTLVFVLVMGLAVRAREAAKFRQVAHAELEQQVALRTAELRAVNEQLLQESNERERSSRRLREARDELAQSNRLATLGQITASVAHEINQPLAALRGFAENAALFVAANRQDEARGNLARIVSLAARIGEITGELRLFARRDGGNGPTSLDEAIDGALLLVGDRLRQSDIKVFRKTNAGHASVAMGRLRLEQILVNLLQNASDAISGLAQPTITITTVIEQDEAMVSVADSGPGVSDEMRGRLFTSFATEKPTGLGLGLLISRDLARDCGGELSHAESAAGATFVVRLPLA